MLQKKFMSAIFENNLDLAFEILNEYPEIDPSSEFVLGHAIAEEHIEFLDKLLQDSRVNPSYNHYNQAYYFGRFKALNVLLRSTRIVNFSIIFDLLNNFEFRFGWISFKTLIKKLFKIRSKEKLYKLILRSYIMTSQEKFDKYLLENELDDAYHILKNSHEIDPSTCNNIAIVKAVSTGYYDFVSELLKHQSVDPTIMDNMALNVAIMDNHYRIAKLLLSSNRFNVSKDIINDARSNSMVRVLKDYFESNNKKLYSQVLRKI